MQASATCHKCGHTDTVTVWKKDWDKYIGGDLLQNVWGYFDPDEREILRGARAGHYFCPPCFDKLHEVEEEEGHPL